MPLFKAIENMTNKNKTDTRSKSLSLDERLDGLEQRIDSLLIMVAQITQDKKREDSEKPSSWASINEITKSVTTLSAMVASASFVFYGLGFIIVNSYLMSFGLREFDLLSPTYLSAGIVFVFTNIVSIAISVGFALLLRRRHELQGASQSSWETIVNWFIPFSAGFLAFFFLGLILNNITSMGERGAASISDYWPYAIFLSLAAFGIEVIAEMLVTANQTGLKQILSQPDLLKKFGTNAGWTLVFILFFSLLLVSLWSQEVYPKISPAFGGGRPITVRVVLADKSKEGLFLDTGIQISSNISEPLQLIDENDESITALLSNGNAVKLSKSLISNIIYLSSQKVLATPTPNSTPTISPGLSVTP